MTQPLGPNQTAWLAALRSGDYSQCTSVLRENDSYCCLGVGCVLAGITSDPIQHDGEFTEWRYGRELAVELAPVELKEWLALRGQGGDSRDLKNDDRADNDFTGYALHELNDIACLTFAQIADFIESDPGRYFTEPR